VSDSPVSEPVTEFRTRRRVEFADTDLGGIVHFARYLVFMETAEHEFLHSLGFEAFSSRDGTPVGWPRVEVSCQYLSPARYGDDLDIHLRIARKGSSSLTYAITISTTGRLVARGRMSSVYCVLGGDNGIESIPMPEALSRRVAASSEGES